MSNLSILVMDKKSLFRNLVTNKYLPDFDYFTRSFSFQTVFYLSPYSSHCCPCAFEHEYLDYIADSGEIDEDVYEKIVNCITDGKCPHVDAALYNYVTETKIYGIHIAAAVGTEEVVLGYRDNQNNWSCWIVWHKSYSNGCFEEPVRHVETTSAHISAVAF